MRKADLTFVTKGCYGTDLMKPHVRRFRIKRQHDTTFLHQHLDETCHREPASHSALTGRPAPCSRCRRLKKRCSRTPPECKTCELAGTTCSLRFSTPPGGAQDVSAGPLQARVAWLEDLIDRSNLSPLGLNMRDIETSSIDNLQGTAAESSPNVFKNGRPSEKRGLDILDVDRHGLNLGDNRNNVATLSDDNERQINRPTAAIGSREGSVVNVRSRNDQERDAVDAYFRDAHRAYMFLSPDHVLDSLRKSQARLGILRPVIGADSDMDILSLVMAIGATSLLRAGGARSDERLQNMLDVDYEAFLSHYSKRRDLETVQVLTLLTAFSAFDPRIRETRPLLRIAADVASHLRLVDDCAKVERGHNPQTELKTRLLWSLFCIDRAEATSLGQPPVWEDLRGRIPLPSITTEEFDSAESEWHVSTLQVFRHLIQLRQIEGKILFEAHLDNIDGRGDDVPSRSGDRARADALRIEIEDWYSSGCLITSTGSDDMALHIRVSWLAGRYYNALILLYYPSRRNPFRGHDELVDLVHKYVYCISVALRQRQLPLNPTTLFRLVPVALVLLMHGGQQHDAQARDGIDGFINSLKSCVEILQSFPAHWSSAHRGASVLQALVSASSGNAILQGQSSSDITSASIYMETLKSVQKEFLDIASGVLGQESVYLA